MPKKILVILVIVLGTLGYAYYYWQNHQSVQIDSYESCVRAQGSRIQESYPATCVTKSGARFIELTPTVEYVFTSSPQKISAYTSPHAKISLTFPKQFFVQDTFNYLENGLAGGVIMISEEEITDNYPPSLAISYGTPYIDGKGGMCADENGNVFWKKVTLLGQKDLDVCEVGNIYSLSYPRHPDISIEYHFSVGGNGLTYPQKEMYKKIITSLRFTN